MPGIAEHRNGLIDNETTSLGVMTSSVKGFWSNQRDDVSFTQLQKFWSELSPQARQKLLKVDKQTLFEQARKNMYCSRCNGLLLEGFLQIVMYSKSLQQEGSSIQHQCNGQKIFKHQNDNNFCVENGCQNVHDPSVHPWGGLTATRDGMLTLLDCYLFSNSLKGLQNVFDCARARERERELLYPDACGGGGRGWISQGMVGYGRGHGTRETCALHTARLSVDTLVDFWSALGEETRQSLLRMKEEDFIERLMYRFDSKRFCRDCRRNVIREFKELKELKRMRKEPHCTSWFCVADTPFQCEVSQDTVQANWNRTFVDTFGVYHHFEWAIGTGEGKSDILDFENVGLNGKVKVTGLDLSGLNACYITLRAWKVDGRCTELLVKAHALKGQHCVHCRLGVGDGFVTITRGLSIGSFFEHAEEIEEEEDDDSIDKDGNDLDGECSRPQKHAKSPELAREFLLDAATVIFKEQVEKAFREGTARQNAHSIFVCLALKLLEERVHVSCKEIITLEKQIKLLEEEENEKREEEERKERKRNKEREKKLRRKERFREKDKDKKCIESNQQSLASDVSKVESTPIVDEESNYKCEEDVHEACDDSIPSSPDIEEEQLLDEYTYSNMQEHSDDSPDSGYAYMKDGHGSVSTDKLQFSSRKSKFQKDFYQEPNMKWTDKRHLDFASETGNRMGKHEHRHHADSFEASRCVNGSKFSEKFPSSNSMTSDRHDSYTRSYNQQSEYRIKHHTSSAQVQEGKYASKLDSAADMPKPCYRGHRNNYVQHARDSFGRQKSRSISSHNPLNRGSTGTQRVWEPMESHKKYPRSNSDSDFTLKSSFKDKMIECDDHKPSSTSNSDDSSENSEGRGSSPHNQFEVSSCRGTSDVESPIIGKEEQHDQNQMQDIGDAQSQISVPPSHNQSLHFPIFQPPIVGFYHQSPISWPTTPANGFLSLPHPNHYVYPSPFSFGLSRNTQVMQYGLLQHPPVLNHGPLPVFQHVCQTNKINSTENQKMDNPGGVKEPHCNDANLPHVISSSDHPKGAADTENGESGNPSDPSAENTGFSLFHFGGPVALSTGLKSGPVSLRGGATSNVTPCADLGEGGHASNVNHCGEEYNLFAASNGIKFSLF